MARYDSLGLEELLSSIEKLGSSEDSNVKIIGNNIIVALPHPIDTAIIYIGSFRSDGRSFIPSRKSLHKTLREAGIVREIAWLHSVDLGYWYHARKWIAYKLNLESDETNILLWTTELMMEYAEKCWL